MSLILLSFPFILFYFFFNWRNYKYTEEENIFKKLEVESVRLRAGEKGVKESFRMEEKDQSSRDAGDESNRAILPLLEPPGNLHRITNFYIDNILRPDFGRRKESATAVNASERSDINASGRENRCPLEEGTDTDRAASPGTGEGASNPAVSGSKSGAESGSDQCANSPNNQQMLWPAWVYCTRYSDRPSSGQSLFWQYTNLKNIFMRASQTSLNTFKYKTLGLIHKFARHYPLVHLMSNIKE